MVVSLPQNTTPGKSEPSSGLEINSLCILGALLDSKLSLEAHLREVSKAAGVLTLELFQCICLVQPRVLCPRVDVVCGVLFGLQYSIVRSE